MRVVCLLVLRCSESKKAVTSCDALSPYDIFGYVSRTSITSEFGMVEQRYVTCKQVACPELGSKNALWFGLHECERNNDTGGGDRMQQQQQLAQFKRHKVICAKTKPQQRLSIVVGTSPSVLHDEITEPCMCALQRRNHVDRVFRSAFRQP